MILAQLTPSQREATERRRAFHASIAAHAAARKLAAEQSSAVKGEYVPAPVQVAPAPPQGLPPQAMPAEPDPPIEPTPEPIGNWFYVVDETKLQPSVLDIQIFVARQYGITVSDMRSPRRTADIVRPRQIAMYIAKELTEFSYPNLGRLFGGKDHTSVLHAFRKIKGLMRTDADLAQEVALFIAVITGVQQ